MTDFCCLDADCSDFEQADDLYIEMIKSEKPRKCVECGCVIKTEDLCEKAIFVFNEDDEDEYEETEYTCVTCATIREDLFCGSSPYGAMWEFIHEDLCGPDECVCPDWRRNK